MALTVEDGSIIEDADSYVTVAEVRSFCTKRGLKYWRILAVCLTALLMTILTKKEKHPVPWVLSSTS